LLAWAYAIDPHIRRMDMAAADQWIAIAFPVGDLLCLAMLIRLLTTSSRRVVPAGLLSAAMIAMLTADFGYNLVMVNADLDFLAVVGRIPLYAAAGFAALSASMTELTRPAPPPSTEVGRLRLVMLAIASLVAPTVLILQVSRHGRMP